MRLADVNVLVYAFREDAPGPKRSPRMGHAVERRRRFASIGHEPGARAEGSSHPLPRPASSNDSSPKRYVTNPFPRLQDLLTVPSGRTQVIALPEPVSELSWSADGMHLGGR